MNTLGSISAFLALLGLGACSAPTDARYEPASKLCTDLSGSYDANKSADGLASLLQLLQLPDEPMPFLSIDANLQSMEVSLHRDRREFVEQAKRLARSDPDLYYLWRAWALGESSVDQSAAGLGSFGPPFAHRKTLPLGRCEQGWQLAGSYEIRTKNDSYGDDESADTTSVHEHELWVSKNASAELLIKTERYRLKYYSIYASAMQSIRLHQDTHVASVAAIGKQDSHSIAASELPMAMAPSQRAAACQLTPDKLTQVSQALLISLPSGAETMSLVPSAGSTVVTKAACAPVRAKLLIRSPVQHSQDQMLRAINALSGVRASMVGITGDQRYQYFEFELMWND